MDGVSDFDEIKDAIFYRNLTRRAEELGRYVRDSGPALFRDSANIVARDVLDLLTPGIITGIRRAFEEPCEPHS